MPTSLVSRAYALLNVSCRPNTSPGTMDRAVMGDCRRWNTAAATMKSLPRKLQRNSSQPGVTYPEKPPLQGLDLTRISTTMKVVTRGQRVAAKLLKLTKMTDVEEREELMASCAKEFLKEMDAKLEGLPQEAVDCISIASMMHRIGMVMKFIHPKDWLFQGHAKVPISLIEMFDQRFQYAEAHHMASVLWGMGQLGRRSLDLPLGEGTARNLIDRIVQTVPNKSDGMKGNSVCHFVEGLSLLYDKAPPGCLETLLGKTAPRLEEEHTLTMNIARLLYGLAELNYEDKIGVVEVGVKQLAFHFAHLGDNHISDAVWALGKLKSPHASRFMLHVQAKAEQEGFGLSKSRMSPRQLIRFVWGMDQLNYKTAAMGIIKKLCPEVNYRRREFTNEQIQEFTDICGNMGMNVGHLIEEC
eukprot:evm.model.scf_328.3 EVM.evm.TU.scf_328.3   scf_328:44911-46860(-)